MGKDTENCKRNILMISKTFGEIFCALTEDKRWTFLEGLSPAISAFHKKNITQKVVWWFGPASSLNSSLKVLLIHGSMNSALYQKHRSISSCPEAWSPLCSRTIRNTPASTHLNRMAQKRTQFWSGLVQIQTEVWLRCFGITLNWHSWKPCSYFQHIFSITSFLSMKIIKYTLV